MNENPNPRIRTLVLGCDFPIFHTYWRTYAQNKNADIIAFVYCLPDPPPIPNFKGIYQEPLKFYSLVELEHVIQYERIQKCILQVSGVPMLQVQSLINRIVATGQADIEFTPPQSMSIRSFKPLIVISSIAPRLGKTQLTRYFCSILRQQEKKVAIIVPLGEILPLDTTLTVEKGPHFEFKETDNIPHHTFSSTDEWQIKQYQKAGAYRVFATSDIRKGIIRAEQAADIILFDSRNCEFPLVNEHSKFCVISDPSVYSVRKLSLWPGLVNLMSSSNVVVITSDKQIFTDSQKEKMQKLFIDKKIFYAQSRSQLMDTIDFTNQNVLTVDHVDTNGDAMSAVSQYGIVSNRSVVSNIPRCLSPTKEIEEQTDQEIESIVHAINQSDAGVVVVSLQKDIQRYRPTKKIIYTTREIYDHGGKLRQWLSQFFPQNHSPPLKKHFEVQVDILMSMAEASDKELFVTNNDSSNREAFCRLFLSSHLPPGFRVTTGEIVDCHNNITGQLDVVIVTDDTPRMTIDSTGSVIAPILADSVLGVVEVKTSLNSETLKKALSQLRPVKALMPTHATLVAPGGEVIEDPLNGKIITGVFAFNPSDRIEQQIPQILATYPNVADFIVLPDSISYFSVKTLAVCGVEVNSKDTINGYVKFSAKGMGLGLVFGTMNCLAATRRFSGSNCVRYLNGTWGGKTEEMQRNVRNAQMYLNELDKFIINQGNDDQRRQYNEKKQQLLNYVEVPRVYQRNPSNK